MNAVFIIIVQLIISIALLITLSRLNRVTSSKDSLNNLYISTEHMNCLLLEAIQITLKDETLSRDTFIFLEVVTEDLAEFNKIQKQYYEKVSL